MFAKLKAWNDSSKGQPQEYDSHSWSYEFFSFIAFGVLAFASYWVLHLVWWVFHVL